MIDFTLTEKDRQLLDQVRAEALVCRKYARYYDEHEEEFIPDEFPEANDFPSVYSHFAGRTENDTSMPVMSMLLSSGQTWGDYSVRLRRAKGWSQEEMAARCRLHRTYIGAIERGEGNITLDTLDRLAQALAVKPNELLRS